MGLQYVVAKRVFGFDKDKNVKYVAKSVGSGELGTDKLCAKVSRILGIHRNTDGGLSGCRTGGHHVGRNRGRKDCPFRRFRAFPPFFCGKMRRYARRGDGKQYCA